MTEKTDQYMKDLGFSPAKTKTPQAQTPDEPQGRDLFQTPNYAVDLLVPYIPKNIDVLIWECACGEGKISKRLKTHGYDVFSTDIREGIGVDKVVNFLSSNLDFQKDFGTAIITNPPFSVKIDFYEKCLEYGMPFALLIPADYDGWNINACMSLGCEKIIPTRRINYLTPNVIKRVNGFENTRYERLDDIPTNLLHKYSSSDFHSMWLTWGFGLGKTETFVELSLEEIKTNI